MTLLMDYRGTDKAFAVEMDLNPAHLSQMKSGVRDMGDEVARRIEERAKLETDWLDVNHAHPKNADEQRLLALFRNTDDRGRASILSVAEREGEY